MSRAQTYLGDGAYCEWNGDAWILTTSDGHKITNTIYLEPEVMAALEIFVAAIRDTQRPQGEIATALR